MTKRKPKQPTLTDLLVEATWLELRSKVIDPLHVTDMVTTDQTRAEFVEGARLLRLDHFTRAGDGGTGPTPIQLAIADMLNAGHFLNGVLEPRRTTKTTSIQAVLLGRCTYREDYQVGWTLATTGAKAAERFKKDIVAPVSRLYPVLKSAPFHVNVGKGTEHLAWPNGSWLNVYAPNSDGFRGGGFDFGWVDEGGEAEPDLSEDLTVAVLPTMDTKPGAQFTISGTAAKYRDGNLLWDTLNDPTAGTIRHGLPDSTDPEELESWEPTEDHPKGRVRALVQQWHPGVGWTTPIEAVQRNFEKFPREKFLAEYLGVFGSEGSNVGIIPPSQWERAARDGQPPAPPKRFTLAIAIHPDGLWASIGVAWRWLDAGPDDLVSAALALDGEAVEPIERVAVGLLWHQDGVQGFANKALAFARKYKTPIIFDQLSQAAGVETETLARAVPRPQLNPATTTDVRRGATKLLKLLDEDGLVHWRAPKLDAAAGIAVKRAIGTAGGFGFGRPKGDYAADITPLEAISLAVHFLDEQRAPASMKDAITFG